MTAEEDVTCYSLDMMTFKLILMGKAKKDAHDYTEFLSNVKLLDPLNSEQKTQLALHLKEMEYTAGHQVVVEGDEGNLFFIILNGEVKCTKMGSSEEVSRRLKTGDFFGELALLSAEKRAATVTTTVPTSVLTLDRATFNRMCAPPTPLPASPRVAARRAPSLHCCRGRLGPLSSYVEATAKEQERH